MIEKKNLGKTEYGGEIYYLKADDPFSIPAVRAYVSTHITKRNVFTKRVRDTEEVIKYFSDNPQKAKKYVQHIIGFGHEDMGEGGYTGIYFKNFSRLFTFISWMPIRSWEKIYGVGTEMSLRYVTLKEDPFIEIEDRRIKDLNEEAFELYKLMIANKVPKEDARYIMPLSTKTEKIIQIPEGRMIRKLVNYLYSSEFEEVSQAGEILRSCTQYNSPITELPSGMPLKEERNREKEEIEKLLNLYGPIRIGFIPPFMVGWKSTGSISSYHQDVRNRQVDIIGHPGKMW